MKIESFLINTKNFSIKDLNDIDKGLFTNIKDFNILNKNQLDYDYLNGAISLKLGDKELLGFKEWDLIDQLWYYFIDAIINLKTNVKVEFSFPDQPFQVIMAKKNEEYITLNLNEIPTTLNYINFVSNMLVAANEFFIYLDKIFPEHHFDTLEYIEKINEAKKVYLL